jgi:hypothetical protein
MQWTLAWTDDVMHPGEVAWPAQRHVFTSFTVQFLITIILFRDSLSAAINRLRLGEADDEARWPLNNEYAAFL